MSLIVKLKLLNNFLDNSLRIGGYIFVSIRVHLDPSGVPVQHLWGEVLETILLAREYPGPKTVNVKCNRDKYCVCRGLNPDPLAFKFSTQSLSFNCISVF